MHGVQATDEVLIRRAGLQSHVSCSEHATKRCHKHGRPKRDDPGVSDGCWFSREPCSSPVYPDISCNKISNLRERDAILKHCKLSMQQINTPTRNVALSLVIHRELHLVEKLSIERILTYCPGQYAGQYLHNPITYSQTLNPKDRENLLLLPCRALKSLTAIHPLHPRCS